MFAARISPATAPGTASASARTPSFVPARSLSVQNIRMVALNGEPGYQWFQSPQKK